MLDYSVILIPMDMHEPIEDITHSANFAGSQPVHVALVNGENPDEFEMAFYTTPLPLQWETNERAGMIARAVADRTGTIAPEFGGDILLRCDKELANLIIKNDHRHQNEDKAVRAFRSWMKDYAAANDLELDDVFHAVVGYVGHVLCEADKAAETKMQQTIADMMGIQPEQVGVIRL